MDIIRVETPRGLELKGAIYDSGKKDVVVVMLTGICSNVFQNDLLDATGKLLSENGITCIIAHSMDSFSCFSYSDFSINKQRTTGVVFDDFSLVYEDVESYVKYVKNLGYKKIVLAGHSLGSNKIIHYLGNTSDNLVDYFIVSSPVDIMHWWNVMPNIDVCYNMAQTLVEEGRGSNILPFMFGGFSPMSADAVMNFYNAENLKNCPVISGVGETKSLNNIKPNGAFIIGSKDSVVNGDPKGFMERINNCTKNPELNKVIVVENASHIFYGKHEEYARIILDILELELLINV